MDCILTMKTSIMSHYDRFRRSFKIPIQKQARAGKKDSYTGSYAFKTKQTLTIVNAYKKISRGGGVKVLCLDHVNDSGDIEVTSSYIFSKHLGAKRRDIIAPNYDYEQVRRLQKVATSRHESMLDCLVRLTKLDFDIAYMDYCRTLHTSVNDIMLLLMCQRRETYTIALTFSPRAKTRQRISKCDRNPFIAVESLFELFGYKFTIEHTDVKPTSQNNSSIPMYRLLYNLERVNYELNTEVKVPTLIKTEVRNFLQGLGIKY